MNKRQFKLSCEYSSHADNVKKKGLKYKIINIKIEEKALETLVRIAPNTVD